ncbi:hypothetical protein KFK09_005424 [Dendrobium nobile]|uniref:Uncharacterized protein n=1 Tax=Dendrobium nobile TaxID=94219 RepID=A0A8T3BVP7_DENNO|nr:hypothetical protein KFK09_005424 [Dendrobium nobile]
MASSFPPGGPSRPRPGYYPPSIANPSPNPSPASSLPGAMQNLQIGRPSAPSGPPPFLSGISAPASGGSRPGPPPQSLPTRPQFQQPPAMSNGPPSIGVSGPRFPTQATLREPAPTIPTHGSRAVPGSSSAGSPANDLVPPSIYNSSFSAPAAGVPMAPPSLVSSPPQLHSLMGGQPSHPLAGGPPSQALRGGPPSQPLRGGPPSQNLTGGPPSQPLTGGPPSQLLTGVPPSQPLTGGPPSQPLMGGPPRQPLMGGPPSQPLMGVTPSQPLMGGPPSLPYMGQPQMAQYSGMRQPLPPSGAAPPFGSPPVWQQQQPRPGVAPVSSMVQAPPQMFGAPPSPFTQPRPLTPPVMGNSPLAWSHSSTPSTIDPNQIPRPMVDSSVIVFNTRQGNQVNSPPPATSDFIVKDTGNCSPRLMRCTMNQIPCSGDLLSTSSMPLVLLVQPMAIPNPDEEPIQVVDFGEIGPIRCSRCKGYINPFMKFVDQGKRFICNLCGYSNETPRDYYMNLGPDGRRRDAEERPELCRGTVEFVATKEYMVRDPMPAVFFFLVDVSMNSIRTGATAAACGAISQAIADLPEGPRTFVGIATFDSAIHFYNLKRALQQPLMLVVPDIQDVYTPLHTDLIVPVAECRQHLEQLLESIPSMFETNKVADSAFGAAIKAAFLALKPTGGKLLVFQSVLPSIGIGSLSSREAEGRTNVSSGEKEAHKLLQPADMTLKTMAIEFAEHQVCVDVFITTQAFVDMASISVVPRTTGGQVYYYYPFSALSDTAKLYNDLRWNISRPQGFEAVMRVRCSQGIQVQEYSGNFCKRIPTDIDLPGIDCDKSIMVSFKHDDKFQEGSECAFQCALLYTTIYGQRRIRVSNLSLPCTSMLGTLFRSADLDSLLTCFLRQAATAIPTSPLSQVREQIMNLCVNILHSYRKFCATVSTPGQLILPESVKLLPLYTLALSKSTGLRNDGRLDERSYWANHVASLSVSLAVPWVYPRMISIHDLTSKENNDPILSSILPLSSANLNDDGIYLLENGEDCLFYVGNMVNSEILQQIFGVTSVDGLPTQFVLQQYDNTLSKILNDVVNEIRRQRCSFLRMRLCRKGDPSGMLFLSNMVEDKSPGGLSYMEFLVHVHRQIQTKME